MVRDVQPRSDTPASAGAGAALTDVGSASTATVIEVESATATAAGHFTTMQLRGGKVQGRDLHLARLREATLELYGIALDVDMLRSRIRDALATAGMDEGDCTLRLRIHPGGAGAGEALTGPEAGHVPLQLAIDIEAPRHPASRPLRVRAQAGPRCCPGIKHLALGHQVDARDAARAVGFDDALFVTGQGHIAEGTFWNVVFWDGREFVWPEGPALRGVTRGLLQRELERARGLPSRQGPVLLGAIGGFSAAFALNTTGIQDIAAIDGHAFPGDARVGAALRALLAAAPWQRFRDR